MKFTKNIELEVDAESIGLYWYGASYLEPAILYLHRFISGRTGRDVSMLALREPGPSGTVLIEACGIAAFIDELTSLLRMPRLDVAELILTEWDIHYTIRFDGTGAIGGVVLYVENPEVELVRRVAKDLGLELGIRFTYSV